MGKHEPDALADIRLLLSKKPDNKPKEIVITPQMMDAYLKVYNCKTKEELEQKIRTSLIYPKDVKFVVVENVAQEK